MRNARKWTQQAAGLAAMALVLMVTAGCSSAGYKKGNKTATNVRKAADRIAALPGQIDKTLTCLDALVNNPQPDLRPQFKAFTANLGDVESSAEHMGAARRAMGEKGKEFLAQWDEQLAEINNEDIKARSQSRKDEVAQKLTAIKISYEQAEQAFRPFIADLRDVQRFLSVDLTMDGVTAVRDMAAKVQQDAGPLNASVAQLASDFQALGLAMSAVQPKTSN